MNLQKIIYYGKLTLSANLHKEIFLPKHIRPESVTIKWTERCNSRCITCDYWEIKSDDKIDSQRAISLLNELHSIGIKQLSFTGGETFLRKDFFSILQTQPVGSFSRIGVITNGLLLGKYSDLINESTISDLVVSLDGIKHTHDIIRGVPGCYDIVMSGLKKIRNKHIKIASILSNKLIPELEDMILFCRDCGYRLSFNIPSTDLPFFKSERVAKAIKELTPNSGEIYKALELLEKYKIGYSFTIMKIGEYICYSKFPIKHCLLPFISIFILSSGDVKAACYLFKPIGNILDQSIQEIVTSPVYLQQAQKAYKLSCPKCLCGYEVSFGFEHPFNYLAKKLRYFQNLN